MKTILVMLKTSNGLIDWKDVFRKSRKAVSDFAFVLIK